MDRLPDKILTNIKRGMHLVWMIYLSAMAGLFPLYLDLNTGYGKIDSDKFRFFWTAGLCALSGFLVLLIFYVFIQLKTLYKKNKNEWDIFSGRILLLSSLKEKMSVTDLFALLYALSLILSYCFSHYQEKTLIGANGWYMGLVPQLILIAGYFITSRLLTIKEIKWIGYVIMTASLLVFLLAILNRYGINALTIRKTDPGFLSTIGNINWLCGYWSVVFPLGLGIFWLYPKTDAVSPMLAFLHRSFLGIVSAIGLVLAVIQGSDSGILTLLALLLLMGWLAGRQRLQLTGFWEILFLFSMLLALLQIIQTSFPDKNTLPTPLYRFLMEMPFLRIMPLITLACVFLLQSEKYGERSSIKIAGLWRAGTIFLITALAIYIIMVAANAIYPGCLGSLSDHSAFLFDENWGSSRGGTWKAGMSVWLSQDLLHKLIGVGPDGMSAYIYSGENTSLLKTVINQFGQHTLTNAHNEWITLLATSGLIGLFGFTGMIFSSIIRFFKADKIWCMVCGLCLFSYTVNNLFSFQQITNITQMFLLLGIGEAMMRDSAHPLSAD